MNKKWSSGLTRNMREFGIIIAFIIILVALMIISPSAFASPRNLVGIVRQAAINGILACGMMFVIISNGIDLSVGSTVALAGVMAAPYIAPRFLKNADSSVVPELIFLTRLMFPYLFVISVAAFFQGILNSVNVFAPSGFTPILFNIAVISAAYALSSKTANPARAMAYGVVAGGTIQALFQLPFVIKQGFKPAFTGIRRAFSDPRRSCRHPLIPCRRIHGNRRCIRRT